MFNAKHYVPILRWKAAEKEALRDLTLREKALMTPIVEVLMPQPRDPKGADGKPKAPGELLEESRALFIGSLAKIPQEILRYWGQNPIFVDLNLVDMVVVHTGLGSIFSVGEKVGTSMIPVVNLASAEGIKKEIIGLARKYGRGLCLRLSRSDLGRKSVPGEINDLLAKCGLPESDIDLLVDLKLADDQDSHLSNLIGGLPSISKWRTLTIASGAFPPDLTKFSVDLHTIPRSDWNNWLRINSTTPKRKASFADYTIQHPIYREPVRGANPSASIRYTLPTTWLIMRGQGLRTRGSAGHAQYPALAQLLSQHDDFWGADFSSGDRYIVEKGRDLSTPNPGTPRTWLRAGINHHLTCVTSQIANLP